MTSGAIIKAGTAAAQQYLRPYFDHKADYAPSAGEKAAEHQLGELSAQFQAMLSENAFLRKQIEDISLSLESRTSAAREEGYKKARQELADITESHADARIKLLESAIDSALSQLAHKMEAVDGLAAMLAHDALRLLFGNASDHVGQVTSMIQEKMRKIGAANVLEVIVSADDFDSDNLAEMVVPKGVNLTVSETVAAAHFSLRLRLGQVDVSLEREYCSILDHLRNCIDLEAVE